MQNGIKTNTFRPRQLNSYEKEILFLETKNCLKNWIIFTLLVALLFSNIEG